MLKMVIMNVKLVKIIDGKFYLQDVEYFQGDK